MAGNESRVNKKCYRLFVYFLINISIDLLIVYDEVEKTVNIIYPHVTWIMNEDTNLYLILTRTSYICNLKNMILELHILTQLKIETFFVRVTL